MDESLNRILQVFHENGLFDEGVQLIGSWCYRLYQKHLGAPQFPIRTQDVDFLIPYPYRGRTSSFINELEQLGFRYDFNSDGTLYLYNTELRIEFLTVMKGRGLEGTIKIKELGISVTALRFVNLLFENPLTIREGSLAVRVPNPANFCLHKLLIASRRKKQDKMLKDLEQAIYTSLISKPEQLRAVYKTLPHKWQRTIISMLAKAQTSLPSLKNETQNLTSVLSSLA